MTDGNHGYALARIARDISMNAVIFVPSNMVPARINKIKDMGAIVEIVEGTYDDAVEYATKRAETDGMKFISDQSFEGYEKIPKDIMTGYIDLFKEVEQQHDAKYTHIFLQAGVGGFAGAGMAWSVGSKVASQAKVICVEPEDADCLMESVKQNQMAHSNGKIDSIMAGLNCGYPSKLAFPIIRERTDCFVSLGNNWAKHGCRLLSKDGVIAGESGCTGLSALMGLLTHGSKEILEELELNSKSIILLVNTEGNTDPEMYERIMNELEF
jgi:diaminopropionate ammonia-lyase